MKRKFAIFLFFISLSLHLVAQQGIFTFYSVNDGLAQSTVTCMYRDTFGLLWVGTGDGLSLFNGYEFKNFKSRLGDSTQISNSRIRAIHPFSNGKEIWVGTEDGLNCFSSDGNRIGKKITHTQFSGLMSIPVYINDTASWFVLPTRGIFRENKNSNAAKLIFPTTFQYRVYLLKQQGKMLFQTLSKEIHAYDVLKEQDHVYELPDQLKGKNIFDAVEFKSGDILLATEVGLWIIKKSNGMIEHFDLGDKKWNDLGKKVNAICLDNNNRIWMGVFGEGLFVWNPENREVRLAAWEQSGLSVQGKLRNIMCLESDPYGIVWAGTDGSGLVKIITDRIFFGEEYLAPLVTDSCNWFVKSFYKDNQNRLWIGTFKEGLKVVDYRNNSITGIKLFEEKSGVENTITCIVPARGNKLYLGTTHGLYLYDTMVHNVTKVEMIGNEGDDALPVNCIYKSKNGKVFVGTNGYLFCIADGMSGTVLQRWVSRSINVSAIYENKQGELIVAAVFIGLFRIESNGHLKDSSIFANRNTLPGSVLINSFAAFDDQSFFAASNFGLIKFSNDLNIERVYSNVNGLPDNMLYGIVPLPDKSYFISTGTGVSIFNVKDETFRNYSMRDGLKSDECNTGALYFSEDNSIFVGGVNGFNSKHFPFIVDRAISPRIYFEKPAVFDLPFNFAVNNPDEAELELKYQQNTFSFQIWQTDFTFSDRTVYHYQLRGFDPDVINSEGRRFVRYAGLDPGDFKFVVGMSFPGYETAALKNLISIRIVPPYWQSNWFRILLVVFILALIGSIIYFILHERYKKVMRKLEIQRQLERVRIRISGDIHDDIGAGLTRIALSSDLVSRQLKDDNPLKSKIINVAASARDLSQSLKEVVWSVKPEYDQLDKMVSYFKGFCGELFEDTNISFSFKTVDVIPPIQVSPEIRRNLFLILKESCNNAMKHSGASKIEAFFQFNLGEISLEIRDNGKGISDCENSREMNSSGLKNMERRATDVGFRFSISKNEWGGCSVKVVGTIS